MTKALDAFCKKLDKRIAEGLTNTARVMTAVWHDELNANIAQRVGSQYFGSEPGEYPYKLVGWFTDAINFSAAEPGGGDDMEAQVGMDLEHAGEVMRYLVLGTRDIEPRSGPVEIINQNEATLADAFKEGVCR